MHVLFSTLNTRLLGFKHVKELYMDNDDFGRVYGQCEHSTFDKYFRYDKFLFKYKISCVSKCSLRGLLMREVHDNLMGYFEVTRTFDMLHKYFYQLNIKINVQRIYDGYNI